MFLGAISSATHSIQIQTPYFLPDAPLISALCTSALRGIRVDILLPAQSNLPWVHWAMQAMLWQVLETGCHVWWVPLPFDHSKLFVVDKRWALFGSSNWDHRSLRLNFELNVETTDPELSQQLSQLLELKRERSQPVLLADVDARPKWMRLRDGFARLFTPML
jgi:cardiolipin synthase